MWHVLLHNWKIKLTCLVLAFILWFVIRESVTRDFVRQASQPVLMPPQAPPIR